VMTADKICCGDDGENARFPLSKVGLFALIIR
jgi:hypothetical protein